MECRTRVVKGTREKLRRADNPLDVVSSRLYDKGKLIEGESLLTSKWV